MATAAALVSLLLAAVAAYNRVPWSDEGYFSSASYNLAHHGFMGTTVLDPTDMHLTRIDSRTYWVMPLYLVGQALWLKVFPATLFAARSFTMLWVPVTLFSFYRFLWRVTSNARASALAVCLLALSFIFIDNADFARPDQMCCALGLSGLAAYVEWREKHLYRALFISNVLIAASGLTHPNGVFHLLGLVLLVLLYDRRRLNFSALGMAILPYVVLGAAWACYILQDYPAFVDQMLGNGTNGRMAATLNPLAIVRDEIRVRYMVAFGLETGGWALVKVLALLAYLGAVAGALFQPGFRKLRSTRLMLSILAVYFVALTVFNQKLTIYLIHILPWYIALTALYVEWLWERFRRLRVALEFAMIGLICVETGGILLKARAQSQTIPQEQAAIDFARAHARSRDRIVGSAALIYGFRFDTRLRDDLRLGTTSGRTPDIIIIDPLYRDLYRSSALDADRPVWKVVSGREMSEITKRLAAYRLAFKNDACQVYLRPDLLSAQIER
jgi:4-amino-4-deoxy-L-arabinose transferase-like glycosyltransferase